MMLTTKYICRTCKASKTNKMHNLTTRMREHPEKAMMDVLLEITNIKPPSALEASLPQMLCDKCRQSLENAYRFVMQARKIHEELLSYHKFEELSNETSLAEYVDDEPVHYGLNSGPETISDVETVELKNPDMLEVDVSIVKQDDEMETVEEAIDDTCSYQIPKEEANTEDEQSDWETENAKSVKKRSAIRNSKAPVSKSTKVQKMKSWHCDICNNEFKSFNALKNHTLKHSSLNEWFSCNHCDRKFYLKDSLKRHIDRLSQQEARIYKKHEYNGPKSTAVEINWCRPHGCKLIQCKLCLKNHRKISDLRKHLAEHMNNVLFDQHGASLQNIRQYLYPHLNVTTEQQLLEQINIDLTNENYDNFYSITNEAGCELSIDSSETESDFEDMDKEEVARRQYECELCGQNFLRKYKLFEHQRNAHFWLDAQHICTRCNARFVSKGMLNYHMESLCNNFNKEYICKKCPLKFRWKENLESHTRTHIKQKIPQTCEECGKTYADEKALTYHMRTAHCDQSKQISCKWCDRKFYRRDYLLLHLKRHGIIEKDIPFAESLLEAYSKPNGTKQISCKLCDLHFESIAELRTHIRAESEPAPSMHRGHNAMLNYTIVNEAGYELDIEDSETDDETILIGKKQKIQHFYTCELCLLKCERKFELMNHQLNVHRNDKLPYKCDSCIFTSVSKDVLEYHKRTLCMNNGKRYVCSYCNYKFMWPENLEMHISKQHAKQSVVKEEIGTGKNTDKKALICPHCERPYIQSRHLNKHIQNVHINGDGSVGKNRIVKKRYLCSQCGSSWETISKLNIHMRKHTGEKPFKCDICDTAFSGRTSMELHRRRHTGDRPFVCSICGKGFVRHGKLKTHMLIHTGLRPYKCTRCDKAFRHSHDVKVHMQQHIKVDIHQNDELICKTCSGVFTERDDLEQHTAECKELVL